MKTHSTFIDSRVTPEAAQQISLCGSKILEAIPAVYIEDFLQEDADTILKEIEYNEGGNAKNKARRISFLANELLPFMRDLSRLHVPEQNQMTTCMQTIRRLTYTPGAKPSHTFVGQHRDFGQSHAVLLNRHVQGKQVYRVAGVTKEVRHNQLTILNAGAEFFSEREVFGTALHGVEPHPDVKEHELENFRRDRILVFTSGPPRTMISRQP